jgi:superfamily II DNA or RNA helicase
VPGEGINGNIQPGQHPNAHSQAQAQAQARAYAQQQQQLKAQARAARAAAAAAQKAKRLLAYVLDVPATLSSNQVVIDLARRARRPNGDWGPLKPWWHAANLPVVRYDPEDRDLLADLVESQAPSITSSSVGSNGHGDSAGTRRFLLKADAQAGVVERLARTGRLRLRRTDGEDDPPAVRWDDQPPWKFGLDVRSDPTGKRWSWRGMLRRIDVRGGLDRMDLAEPMVLQPGLVVQGVGKIARFDDAGLFLWVMRMRHEKEMAFSDSAQQDAMLEKILVDSLIPASELIESETLKLREVNDVPQPCLTLRTPRQNWGTDRLIAELGFDYSGAYIPIIRPGNIAVRTDLNLIVQRQIALEQAAGIQLYELGFKDAKDHLLDPGSLEIPAKRVPQVTKELVLAGWRVEAEGKLIRQAGEFKLAVTTGIDWFELGGQVDFGGQTVPLPDLLAAARRGETMVSLGDGSMGMLPEDWLKKYGMLADLGSTEDENGPIRFGKAQAGLLDALLASQPEIKLDIGFGKVRQHLPRFEGVVPKEAPAGFRGELRPYQCEGLGWLEYLQKFDFGGILADDMGLGKTVQVLALLQSRRARRLSKGPSLIVVPRSLVFNWKAEAEKFCPRLRVLDYTGPNRHASREDFPNYDLIITTFGTLRTDIVELSQTTFDYVILDEAQAIKNADSQAAKAARLLKGRHRLAMSGTPIENHLGELWSIFEFLNPGMLGTASVFKKYATGASAADEASRSLLARALRPFILRRTKAEVVQDLPEKFEQTLFCDLEPEQRKLYESLKAHYRQALLRKEASELGRSKIEVLEALLRLRQAACHPGLIDPERSGDASAKLDMLIPQLVEVAEEGHKVLVFSQFTKFLGLVRDRLDAEGLKYEYLDGRTRNREERVEKFQNDPTIPLFLISLKAGGLGLNLTAAGYVYLLDPWWNPAVEAQAIDRSHRIGQTQQVFAYRLICRDTVEQKILELQQKKRDLADAILNENRNVIGTLTKDDLEFLLS